MQVLQRDPLNAQLSNAERITDTFLTPASLTFNRNHGDVPAIDAESYRLQFTVAPDVCVSMSELASIDCQPISKSFSLADIKTKWKQSRIVAVLECAGNRRSEMNVERPTEGLPWGASVIANAEWQGPCLQDILASYGLASLSNLTGADKYHITFTSQQQVQEDQCYQSSIPLSKLSTTPIILAYAQNGEPLTKEHGYPLRVIIPGYIGARSVKWLDSVSIELHESENFYQTLDYKRLEPRDTEELLKLTGENINLDYRKHLLLNTEPLNEQGPTCAITRPSSGDVLALCTGGRGENTIRARGYAVGVNGSPVAHVHLAVVSGFSQLHSDHDGDPRAARKAARDSGAWVEVQRLETEGGTYINGVKTPGSPFVKQRPTQADGKSWSWCIWEATIEPPPGPVQGEPFALVARVETKDGVHQDFESVWNVRGVDNRSWFVTTGLRAIRPETRSARHYGLNP